METIILQGDFPTLLNLKDAVTYGVRREETNLHYSKSMNYDLFESHIWLARMIQSLTYVRLCSF